MAAVNLRKAYLLQLSGGYAWELGPCEGADEELGSWVDEFSSHLGLMRGEGRTARKICFGRVLETNGHRDDCRSSFIPPLAAGLPSEGWHEWGRAGAVLLRHPEVMDVFCGLYPSRSPFIERMRHALVPVFDEIIEAGGMPIHGALLEWRGAGVLLLGESGAGKSTSCRRLPSGWRVHGDDLCLVVRNAEEGFRAHPMPTWSAVEAGEVRWPCLANRSVTVQALFRLRKSVQDRCEPISPAKATVALTDACAQALKPHYMLNPRSSAALRSRIFDNAAALARSVPAFRLHVSLTGRFWEMIEAILEKGDRTLFGERGASAHGA